MIYFYLKYVRVCVPPTQCTFLHAIHSDCVVLHCLHTFRSAASSIPVVYIVIGCCLGVAAIVGLIILVAIVLVCIFRGQL